MQFFSTTNKSIYEVSEMFKKGSLIVDDSYQRRSVWGERDKIRLIETILLNLIMPELFFWKAETDPDTGETITHIVDGQQRINSISGFVNNEFKLKAQYFLDDDAKAKYSNMKFSELSQEIRKNFWNYNLRIIEFSQDVNREDIVKIFRRLNLTDYNLNAQEKRNSMSGIFAVLAREIADNEVWTKYTLFNATDIKRMKDVEFCANIILLQRAGIIDQTDQTALNQAYADYQSEYPDASTDKDAILNAIDMLEYFLDDDDILCFLKRKAQLYTFFCILFYMQRENVITDVHIKNRLIEFVKLYSKFNNDLDFNNALTVEENSIFDILKKYKLASSEGLNKYTNRMIRLNAIKDFLFCLDEKQLIASQSFYSKLDKLAQTNLESESDDDEIN